MNKMPKILFLATSANSTSGGGRTRIIDLARLVFQNGIQPMILCFLRGDQLKEGFRSLLAARKALEKEAACKVLYFPQIPFIRFSALYRINNYYCAIILLLVSRINKVDLIFGHGQKAGYLGIVTRRINKRLKIITDMQGELSEEAKYGIDPSKIPDQIKRIEFEQFSTIKGSNWIIFVSHAMQDHFENKYDLSITNCSVIPCAVMDIPLMSYEERNQSRLKEGLQDKFVVCYAGSAEEYQLPEEMCKIYEKILLYLPSAFFQILTPQGSVFVQYLHALGIHPNNYKILNIPHTEVFKYLQIADMGLLLRDSSLVNRVASPTKFAEYCIAGLPVLMTDAIGDFSDIVKEHEIGMIYDPSALDVDKRMIDFLSNIHENRSEYYYRINSYAREYLTWDVVGPRLVNRLMELADQ